MAADVTMGGTEDFELPSRKKPKVSELPLSSAQRSSIDGLLHTFKKKGEFDAIRKKAFQQYNESAQRGMFEASLRNFSTNEIEREPIKYLKPDRRIAAPLLEGAAARASSYGKTEEDINAYIDQYIANAEKALREIRVKEIGEEAAAEEVERGNKSDAAYATEAEQRREERAKMFVQNEKVRKKQEVQERKKKELEALKKKQEELQKETDRLQREQKRRTERDAFKAAEKEKDRVRIQKYNEEQARIKREAEEQQRVKQEAREKREKERNDREQKRLEDEALDLLLKQGKEMAEKGRGKELERSESMEPPVRLSERSGSTSKQNYHSSAPRNYATKEEMRSQGLMPTSLTLRKGDKSEAASSTPAVATPGAKRDEDRSRTSRVRSPSPDRRREDDDRRPARRDREKDPRRESLYRDISAERAAWKARLRDSRDRDRDGERETRNEPKGEEGEVLERPATRARSRSRDSRRERRRRDDVSRSRTPPRRFRERSRSRSPPRRQSSRSAARRERSRSPPGIDRYVPGGGGGGGAARRPRDDDRDRRGTRDDDRRSTRDDDKRDDSRRAVKGETDEKPRDRERERDRDRDRDDDRRKSTRTDDRPKPAEIDRYIPGGNSRAEDIDRSTRRRERSRSRDRDRERDRDRRDRSRDRDRDRPRERDREREKAGDKEKPERRESVTVTEKEKAR